MSGPNTIETQLRQLKLALQQVINDDGLDVEQKEEQLMANATDQLVLLEAQRAWWQNHRALLEVPGMPIVIKDNLATDVGICNGFCCRFVRVRSNGLEPRRTSFNPPGNPYEERYGSGGGGCNEDGECCCDSDNESHPICSMCPHHSYYDE